MVSAPSPQSQGSPCFMLNTVWSWVFPAQSHIQYRSGNKPLFSTHTNTHPALVSRTSQRREGENVTFRGHILIPFCFIPLPFRKTTNPPHHVEVEILWGGQLRTQHLPLNQHLHRIGVKQSAACPLCDYPSETVEHLLFFCRKLTDIRGCLLPKVPSTSNCLYSSREQLEKTCTYYRIALSRRANAQNATG